MKAGNVVESVYMGKGGKGSRNTRVEIQQTENKGYNSVESGGFTEPAWYKILNQRPIRMGIKYSLGHKYAISQSHNGKASPELLDQVVLFLHVSCFMTQEGENKNPPSESNPSVICTFYSSLAGDLIANTIQQRHQ